MDAIQTTQSVDLNHYIDMLVDSGQRELVIDGDDQLALLLLLEELTLRRSDAKKRACNAAKRTCYCGACVTLHGRLNDDPHKGLK